MMTSLRYAEDLVGQHPTLHSLILFLDGVSDAADVQDCVRANLDAARCRLQEAGSESQIESIQQWRSAYRQSGTDPTKFRMAAESILRRLRTSDEFTTSLHPLVVLCNSFSARYAVPVAALDIDRIESVLTVGYASGQSVYQGFDGNLLTLPAGEVTFEDEAGRAHARKWSHKQSGLSAMSSQTSRAFVIAEGLHEQAGAELSALLVALRESIQRHWPGCRITGQVLTGDALSTGVDYPFASSNLLLTSR